MHTVEEMRSRRYSCDFSRKTNMVDNHTVYLHQLLTFLCFKVTKKTGISWFDIYNLTSEGLRLDQEQKEKSL